MTKPVQSMPTMPISQTIGHNARYAVLLLMLLLAACGPGDEELIPTTTPLPTATPSIDNAGQPNNPLRMFLQAADPDVAAALETDFEDAILQASNVSVDVQLVTGDAQGLAAVCDANTPRLSVAWLTGVGALAALEQQCGNAVLRIERDGELGEPVAFIVDVNLGVSDLEVLRERTFCRVNVTDFTSWLVPLMVFRTRSISPTEFSGINDYADYDALLQAVADGDCAGAAVPLSVYDASAERNNVRRALVTVRMPYPVLVYPALLPQAARLSLTDGLLAFDPQLEEPLVVQPVLPVMPTATPQPTVTATPEPENTPEATSEATPETTAEVVPTSTPTMIPPTPQPPDPVTVTNLYAPFFGPDVQIIDFANTTLSEIAAFVQSAQIDLQQMGN